MFETPAQWSRILDRIAPEETVSPDELRRRTRIHNEVSKLRATALNSVGVGLIVGGVLVPLIRSGEFLAFLQPGSLLWILIGVALHVAATRVLRALRLEE